MLTPKKLSQKDKSLSEYAGPGPVEMPTKKVSTLDLKVPNVDLVKTSKKPTDNPKNKKVKSLISKLKKKMSERKYKSAI